MKTKINLILVFLFACCVMHAQDYSMVGGKFINSQIDMRLESCIRDGNTVTIIYYLKNNTGKDFDMLYIGSSSEWCGEYQGEKTIVIDNLGNNYTGTYDNMRYNIEQELNGTKKQHGETSFNCVLPNGIWVKGIYTMYKIDSRARSFQKVNIAFSKYGGGNLCRESSFGFTNLPIYTQEDIAEYERQELLKEVKLLISKAEAGDAEAQYKLGNYYMAGYVVVKNSVTALEWYHKSAMQNYAPAYRSVGDYFYKGDVSSRDYKEAMEYYGKAASLGDVDAQAMIGEMYYYGIGVTEDKTKAIQYLEKAAIGGSSKGKSMMGYLFYSGYFGTPNYSRALSLFIDAANKGDKEAQFWLGCMYASGDGVQENLVKAAEFFHKSAEQGYCYSMGILGVYYLNGTGVNQDINRAINYLEKAVAGGDISSLNSLGEVYYYDKYRRKNLTKAVDYWKQAADQGDAAGLLNMGFAYRNGIGVLKNPQMAIEYYEKAAGKGNGGAQYQLGIIYKEANNLPKSLTWFEKAAIAGNADAQYETGLMYYYGKGTVKNTKKAADYIEKAYNSGHKDASKVWNDLSLWKYKGSGNVPSSSQTAKPTSSRKTANK